MSETKAANGSVVLCQEGNVIEIECRGMRCRAMITHVDAFSNYERMDVRTPVHSDPAYVTIRKSIRFTVEMESSGEVTTAE